MMPLHGLEGGKMRALVTTLILMAAPLAHAQPNKDLYELQVRCGRQAAAAFARDYVAVENTKDGQRLTNYENHFNPRLNKCFFLEIFTFIEKGMSSKLLRLFDLNENKEYGSYWDSDAKPHSVHCNVGNQRCSSEEEWRKLAKPYLED
jgi:hypothetical protein